MAPSVETVSNPATTAIATPVPASIETLSDSASPFSADDIQPSVETLSNPVLANESKADVITSATVSEQQVQALSNPSVPSSKAFTTIDPILANSTEGKAENNTIEEVTSISEQSDLEDNSTQEQVTSVSQ